MFKRLREFYSSITTIDVLNFIVHLGLWSMYIVIGILVIALVNYTIS